MTTINNLDRDGWTRSYAIMDFGAAESVAPPSVWKSWPVRETAASYRDQQYNTADGNRIPNLAERVVPVSTEDGLRFNLTYQVAPVTRPLNNVSKICDKGNVVVFDEAGGYIQNMHSGEQRVYMLGTWTKNDEKPDGRRRGEFKLRTP